MEAKATKKEDLLLDEEIDRSGVQADLEKDKNIDTDLLDKVEWTPSARGEPGKTPRDLAFGPLKEYCADLYEVTRRTTRTMMMRWTHRSRQEGEGVEDEDSPREKVFLAITSPFGAKH